MKMCPECTTNNPDDAVQCSRCEYRFPPPKRHYDYPKDTITRLEDHAPSLRSKIAAIAGIIAMILTVSMTLTVCSPMPGLIGMIMGYSEMKALKDKKKYSSSGEKYASFAIWCGWISVSVGGLMIILGVTVSTWFFQWFRDVQYFK
ncbi:DUF4190 domain-containing protein [bacterium]|nr:DUF4190 domain-containing protein [bacterium]